LKPITLVVPNDNNNNILGSYNNLSINSKANNNSNIYRGSNIYINNTIPNSNTNISTHTTINENPPNSIIINQAKS
jgi:hypothetical protein